MNEVTSCPACGSGELSNERRGMEYSYKGVPITISDVMAAWCNSCGEATLGPEESRRVADAMSVHQRAVNATMYDSTFIASVRKKLGLSQKEAAELFGGGVNAFSRYERGTTKPPLALLKLFVLLNNHPELLDEIR